MLSKLDKIEEESRKDHQEEIEVTSMVEERAPNEEQKLAIKADVNSAVRVLAPPGSGKTFIIENRYKFLLDNEVSPDQILAVTFTKKMATELYERILSSNPGIVGSNADKQVCTIHAACFRILYAEGMRLQVAKEWQVKKLLTDDKVGIIQKLWGFDNRPGWRELENWIAMPKHYAVTVEDSLDFYNQRLPKQAIKLAEARRLFDEGLQRQRLFTFSDMMYLVERLFIDRPEVLNKYQQKYTHIIVDEGQDTSAQAMRILTLLAKPQDNFFIVGDSDQQLFRFAGATPEDNLFEGFEKRYPDATSVLLKINYRSTGAIIRACKQLIDTNYHDKGGPYAQEYRKAIEARPGANEGNPIHFQMYKTVEEEASAAVDTIEELIASGEYQNGDIFVGARTRAQLGYLEGGLVRKKIPFVNISGGSFWASRHVSHLVSYAMLAIDTTDKNAFLDIYNVATNDMVYPWGPQKGQYCNHRWLGKAFLQACNSEYKGINQAAIAKRMWRIGVQDLEMFMMELQMRLETDTPAEVLQFIVDGCYRRYLVADEGLLVTDQESPEGTKFDDLSTVVDVARQFNEMSDFVSYVKEAQKAAEAIKDKKLDEYVVLSTIHSLKGLERPVVFGLGMAEGMTIGANGVSPAGLLPHTFSLIKPSQMGVLPVGGMGRVEDERCAAYVLVSRAKERVFLSGCGVYKKSQFRASRFIKELGIEENLDAKKVN